MTGAGLSRLRLGSRLAAIAVLTLPAFSQSVLADDRLEAGFAEPPKSARPSAYYRLLNGHADLARILWPKQAIWT